MATEPPAPAPASPTGARTLSAAFAEDRRREARRRAAHLLPGPGSRAQVMLMLHRWGASCLPKSNAALRARAATPTQIPQPRPSSYAPTPPAAATQTTGDASVAATARRPLREREEAAAAGPAPTPTESHDKPAAANVAVGDGSNWRSDTATTVGRGANIWVRVSRKPSPQVESSPRQQVGLPAAAEDKYVWADMYRPSVLGEFICNKAVADELHRLVTIQVTTRQCNHFIFEGMQAVGKRSMVLALLRDAFGPQDLKIEERPKRIELKGEIAKHIDIKIKSSDHHVEVNLSDLHGYEKQVITTLLNESIPPPDLICDHTNCRVIVVHDADRISSDLQHYIGWFLGRYVGCSKIIFCCSNSSNLEAVKHLCKVITLLPPSFDEIIRVLEFIAAQEGIYLPREIASRIATSASTNLRQAIRSFEATWKANYPFVEDQPILTGWEEEISDVAKKIMEEPSPKQLYLIRGKIRKMIEHNVSPYYIFCHLVTELKRDRDEDFQNSIDELASELNQKKQCKDYKSRDSTSNRRDINIEGFAVESPDQGEAIQCFIKIEEFTVRFMSFYRSLIVAKNSSRGDVV